MTMVNIPGKKQKKPFKLKNFHLDKYLDEFVHVDTYGNGGGSAADPGW